MQSDTDVFPCFPSCALCFCGPVPCSVRCCCFTSTLSQSGMLLISLLLVVVLAVASASPNSDVVWRHVNASAAETFRQPNGSLKYPYQVPAGIIELQGFCGNFETMGTSFFVSIQGLMNSFGIGTVFTRAWLYFPSTADPILWAVCSTSWIG